MSQAMQNVDFSLPLDLSDMCRYLRVSRNTVLRLLRSGEIKGASKVGRSWRCAKSALDEYVARKIR